MLELETVLGIPSQDLVADEAENFPELFIEDRTSRQQSEFKRRKIDNTGEPSDTEQRQLAIKNDADGDEDEVINARM